MKVAVIGAGLAGSAAARALADRGADVTLFDKARGLGGRTSVRRAGGFFFDHGAQYFTVRNPRFRDWVDSAQAVGVVRPWEGLVVTLGSGAVEPSPSQTRYVGVPGMSALAKHLVADLPVHTRTRIARVDRSEGQWLLHDAEGGERGRFDALVVAVPAVQAAELLTGAPDFAARAAGQDYAPCWAVMLGFTEPLGVPFDGARVQGSPLGWLARNSSKPRRGDAEAWVLHATPDWSRAHLDDPPEHVGSTLTRAFFEARGEGRVVPALTLSHRWRYALPTSPDTAGSLGKKKLRLAVCGDWCRGARVEDAFLSGLAAADRLSPSPAGR